MKLTIDGQEFELVPIVKRQNVGKRGDGDIIQLSPNLVENAYALKPIAPKLTIGSRERGDDIEFADLPKDLQKHVIESRKQPVAKEPKWGFDDCELGGIHIEWKNNWPTDSQLVAIKEAVNALMEFITTGNLMDDDKLMKARAALRENK